MKTRSETGQRSRISRLTSFSLFMGLVLATACTVERPTQWPQGEEEGIFEISALNKTAMDLQVESLSAQDTGGLKLSALDEAPKATVVEAKGEERLKSLFKDLQIEAPASEAYKVKFTVDAKHVTAYKVLEAARAEELSLLEQQLAVAKGDELLVPLFQVSILEQGTIEHIQNDLGEDTRTLRIHPTDPAKATHIKISTLAVDREPVALPPGPREERILLANRLNNALLTTAQLDQQVGLRVAINGLFLTKLDGKKLILAEVTQISKLPADQQEIVRRQLASGGTQIDVVACSKDILAQIPAALKNECIVVNRYAYKAESVVAFRKPADQLGSLESDISFNAADRPNTNGLIRIVEHAEPDEELNLGLALNELTPTRALEVDTLKNQEFLMRRTLQDSPNGFQYTFAGSSGRLELVKFLFESDKVRVVRVDPLLRADGTTDVDHETLMSIPASYVKVVKTDADGTVLARPRIIPATSTEAGAIAQVDWTNNSIPTISSPLEYYGIEQCFDGAREHEISEVDQRVVKDGMLSFTLGTTFAASRYMDCAGLFDEDYFDVVQKTFTFKERISFKRYERPAAGDEKPLLNLPYEAQKRLGFGIFTYSKKAPDEFGRVGDDGTVVPLPALFDVKSGKKITYVLAGLPQGNDAKTKKLRETITKSTQRVIDDLNVALKKAFADTPLKNLGNIVELKVEGVDSEPRVLGDLDRNYIYYVQKATESGVIGLGGAHSNPRSGSVEAASVFLYGGNMIAMIEDMKTIAKARKEYNALMSQEQDPEAGEEAGVEAAETGAPEGTAPTGTTPTEAKRPHVRAGGMKLVDAGLDARLTGGKLRYDARKHALELLKKFERDADRLTKFSTPRSFAAAELTQAGARLNNTQKRFNDAVREAIAQHSLGDATRSSALFRANKKNPAAPGVAGLSGVIDRMRQNNICVMQVSDSDLVDAAAEPGLEERDSMDILADVWASTLSHEIGHNLGLRHNFIASFDKANWKFDKNDKSKRNYSSVMDYISDEFIKYDGYGPQDVAAFRAAYAGLVEVDPAVIEKLPELGGKKVVPAPNGQLDLVAKKFIKIDDIPQALGQNSWLNIDAGTLSQIPLKNYKFCSDEDAGLSPTCNRFDMGSTPEEIVDNAIKGYREMYGLRNFPGVRLRFAERDTGEYIGRMFARFIPIRQFLEETFYQLIQGADGDTINAYVPALVKGLFFFHEVVRQADAPAIAAPADRFTAEQLEVPAPTEADPNATVEKILPVEAKFLKDTAMDDVDDRLRVRGVEFDKAIALILLTARDLGFPRYESISLRIAYPDFERMAIPDAPSPLALPTVGLLGEVLSENVQAVTSNPKYGMLSLPATYKATTTDLTRFQALAGAILNLDVDGLDAGDNNSILFRAMNGFKITGSSKTPFITQPGSTNDLKYWATSDALATQELVNTGVLLGRVKAADKDSKLSNDLAMYFVKSLQEEQAGATSDSGAAGANPKATKPASADPAQPAEPAEPTLAELEASINKALGKLPKEAGPRTVKELMPYMNFVVQTAAQLEQLQGNPLVDPKQIAMEVERASTMADRLAKSAPTTGLAMAAMPGEALGLALLDQIKPARSLATQEGIIFQNVQLLSNLFYMAHPEYRR